MSQKYALTKTDLMKIGKGALIAIGGAFLTYLSAVIGDINFTVNYQDNALNLTPFVSATISILINASWKFLEGQSSKESSSES
jgi:hypothetical protein